MNNDIFTHRKSFRKLKHNLILSNIILLTAISVSLRISMNTRHLIYLLLCAGAAPAAAYEMKGVGPGTTLASLQQRIPIDCKPWLNGILAQRCFSTKIPSSFNSVGDQDLVSLTVLADNQGKVHSMTFYMACGYPEDSLGKSLVNRFGNPQPSFKLNYKHIIWKNETGSMLLSSGDSSNNSCSRISLMDAEANAETEPKPFKPSKDF